MLMILYNSTCNEESIIDHFTLAAKRRRKGMVIILCVCSQNLGKLRTLREENCPAENCSEGTSHRSLKALRSYEKISVSQNQEISKM